MIRTILLLAFANMLLSACNENYNKYNSSPNKKKSEDKTSYTYHLKGEQYSVLKSSQNYTEKGIASWYGRPFHQRRTSSGERYNMYKLTAAHKTLPLSSHVLVTNLLNGKNVVVKVNDRGPFVHGRSIDLSYAAAKKIGIVHTGTAPVSIKAISIKELASR